MKAECGLVVSTRGAKNLDLEVRQDFGDEQTPRVVLIATRRWLSRASQCVRAPLTTGVATTNDERYKSGANRARILWDKLWPLETCRPSGGRMGGYPGPVAWWRPPRWQGAVVWRCTPGGRAVLSEVCGRFKSAFFFRHAAPPRNQHQRSNRVSSRRLREIDPVWGVRRSARRRTTRPCPPLGRIRSLLLPVVLVRTMNE